MFDCAAPNLKRTLAMLKLRSCIPGTLFAVLAITTQLQQSTLAQQPAPAAPRMPTAEERAAITAGSQAERARELKLLGITEMQPPATAYDIGKPGNANYDETKANPY